MTIDSNKTIRRGAVLCLLTVLAGCSTNNTISSKPYKTASKGEADAFRAADIYTSPNQVRRNFLQYRDKQLGWAGIIRDVRFKETERNVQVAFLVEHHYFDWKEHSGAIPYRLLPNGEGAFTTGWIIEKPTDINYLRKQAQVGDMLLAYGIIHSMKKGVIRLDATFVHPIPRKEYVIEELPSSSLNNVPPPQE